MKIKGGALAENPNYRWHVVGMLWLIVFFNYADRQGITAVFPLLQREMGLSDLQLGMVGSAFAWTYGLAAPFAGMLVDRAPRNRIVLAGLTVWSLICALTAAAWNAPSLLICRAAEGLGETFYFPASMSMLADYHPPRTRSRALGLHQSGVYAGIIVGSAASGLIGQYMGWRWSFIILGALGILLAAVLRFTLHEPPRGQREQEAITNRELLRLIIATPTARYLLGGFLCANFVTITVMVWMPKHCYDKFGLSLPVAGLAATLFVQLGSAVGSILGGRLADSLAARWHGGRAAVQAAGLVLAAPFVWLSGSCTTVGMLVTSLALLGLFKGFYEANIFASMFDVMPASSRGRMVGVMNMVAWLGAGGTAPVIVGYVAGKTSLSHAIASAASVYVVGSVLLVAAAFSVGKDRGRAGDQLSSGLL